MGLTLTKIRNKLQSLSDDYHYYGFKIAIRNILLWLVRKIITYRIAILFEAEVKKIYREELNHNKQCDFSLKPFSSVSSDLLEAADINPLIESNRAGKTSLVVGQCNKTEAFVGLLTWGQFTIPKRHTVNIPTNTLYISCCYTIPKFRGQRLYSMGLKYLAAIAEEKGAKKVCLFVEFENEASLSVVKKIGFKPTAKSIIISCGPILHRKFSPLSYSKTPSFQATPITNKV